MKHRFTTATALLFAIGLAASSPVLAQSCSNPDIKALVAKEWAARMPDLQSSVQSGMQHGAPDEYLYTTQVLANNLLHMAIQCNNKTMVSELAAILVLPATLRVKVMDGNWFDASGHYVTNPLPTVEWVYGGANCGGVCGHDAHLPTVQFMYMISEAIEYISSLNPLDRTIQLKFLYEAYVKMLVHDHILRWGPIYGSADIFEFGLALPPIPYYAVQDKQVFLIATAARVLSANINTGHNLLTVAESEILTKFVRDGIALLEKRTVYPQLQNGSGASVPGYSFDPYYGLDPTDGQTKYAGYTGTDSPVLSNPPVPEQRVATLSWDISHGRRFVHYLLTMRSLTSKLGLQQSSLFNTKAPRDMANQVAFKLFNGNPQYPLFANYLDGTNGWFRTGYNYPTDPGQGPSMMSTSIPTGGYFFLREVSDDLNPIMRAVADLASSSDPAAVSLVAKYYGYPLFPGQPGNLSALMFYPTLINLVAPSCASMDPSRPSYCQYLP